MKNVKSWNDKAEIMNLTDGNFVTRLLLVAFCSS